MTSNQHQKRLARERAAATGESYTKALYEVRESLCGSPSLTGAVWNGETVHDPLVFFVGREGDTDERVRLDLGGKNAHVAVTGGAGTGKSNLAQVIAAQVLTKQMPWDSALRGRLFMVTPHLPEAEGWIGRPGVVTSHDERGMDGEVAVVKSLSAEWERRKDVLARGGDDVADWLALPEEVKKRERLAPILVVVDDYPFYVAPEHGGIPRSRQAIVGLVKDLVRAGRVHGIHVVMVAQVSRWFRSDPVLRQNLSVQVQVGPSSPAEAWAMFGDQARPEMSQMLAQARHFGWLLRSSGEAIEPTRLLHLGHNRGAVLDKHLARGSSVLRWPALIIGQKVRFAGERTSMTVRAVSEDGRFVALTRPFNLGKRSKWQYTVIDFAQGIRGTATSWGVGFDTDEQCRDAVEAFVAGAEGRGSEGGAVTSEVSWRNWAWLRFTDRQVDPRTEQMLPWLRHVMAVAPARDYNDHEPRQASELAAAASPPPWAATTAGLPFPVGVSIRGPVVTHFAGDAENGVGGG